MTVSDDFGNTPFKALKKAKLNLKDDDADGTGKKKKPKAPKPQAAKKPPEDDLAAQDELFLRAMGGRSRRAARPRQQDDPGLSQPFEKLLEEDEKRRKQGKDGADSGAAPEGAPAPASTKAPGTPQPAATRPAPDAPPAEEADLFLSAMDDVQPMDGTRGRDVPKPCTPPEPKPPTDPDAAVREHLEKLVAGKIDFDLEFTDEYQHGHVVGLDPKIFNKLRAGSYTVEAHQDLHGLNTEQALLTTVDFIRRNYLLGKRHLLLVTGRGRNSPDGRGILRDEAQMWLTREPLRRVVLAFVTALPRDGGAGALYILLRKYKKSLGKVQWDRLPKEWMEQ